MKKEATSEKTVSGQNQHTPGPWISAISEKPNRAINIYGGTPFTDVTPIVAYALPLSSHRTEERNANARLIAAAPELLEACKLALQGYDEQEIENHGQLIAVRDAIAKAERQ